MTKRKLAAILFVDIAGFTDRANRDERAALSAKDAVEKQIKAAAAIHHGRVVKMLGDGGMLEFASAVEAVSCALAIQDAMEDVNRTLGLDEPVQLRIGVHTGDVVEEGEDIFGNAVNIASRVQALATPGRICITREVFMQIRPILNLRCSPIASDADGRMPEPVEVLQIDGSNGVEASVSSPARPRYRLAFGMVGLLLAIGTIAVMNRPTAPVSAPETVHRVLLPDWVSPGEWFPIDAGPLAEKLTVYFGNRQAKTRIEGNQLMVQTPGDLPSERTTISVFEDQQSKPMLAQGTHIVRPKVLAMNSAPKRELPEAEPVTEESTPAAEPSRVGVPSAGGSTTSVAPPKTSSSKPTSAPKTNSTEGRPGTATIRSGDQVQTLHVGSILGKDFEGFDEEFKRDFVLANTQPGPPPEVPKVSGPPPRMPKSPVYIALRSARSGDSEEAKKAIEEARKGLEDVPPHLRTELEALIKTAEALAEDHAAGKQIDPRAMQKWAEAFAFSVNSGAKGYTGFAMVDRMIRAGKRHEAQRALDLLRKRSDVSEGELKALDVLQKRIDQMPARGTGGSSN